MEIEMLDMLMKSLISDIKLLKSRVVILTLFVFPLVMQKTWKLYLQLLRSESISSLTSEESIQLDLN